MASSSQVDRFRYSDLDRLMLMAKTNAQVLQFVSIGAGDAFIDRYWRSLRAEVELGHVSLLVVDQMPLEALAAGKVSMAREAGEIEAADRLEQAYRQLCEDIIAHQDTHSDDPHFLYFVDLSSPCEQAWLDRIRADVVFVLVPDQFHIRVAKRWLKRATLIMIEKPYDSDFNVAEGFEQDLKKMLIGTDDSTHGQLPCTVVSPFDHYLAKIHNYVRNHQQAALLTGPLQRVEFTLLESGPVEQWRADALSAGMIYDLFSHVLAMLSVELDLNSFQFPHKRTAISVARHTGLKNTFVGDTFASFEFTLQTYQGAPVDVVGQVGKGVGTRDVKQLVLVGRDSTLRFELGRGDSGIFKKERDVKLFSINKGHDEFVQSIVQGQFQEQKIGWLPGSVALKILQIIYNIRKAMPRDMHPYDPGTAKEVVMAEATPLGGRPGRI